MNQEQDNLLKQNIHVMTEERLEDLGWQFDDFWNNRAMFSKKMVNQMDLYFLNMMVIGV